MHYLIFAHATLRNATSTRELCNMPKMSLSLGSSKRLHPRPRVGRKSKKVGAMKRANIYVAIIGTELKADRCKPFP